MSDQIDLILDVTLTRQGNDFTGVCLSMKGVPIPDRGEPPGQRPPQMNSETRCQLMTSYTCLLKMRHGTRQEVTSYTPLLANQNKIVADQQTDRLVFL